MKKRRNLKQRQQNGNMTYKEKVQNLLDRAIAITPPRGTHNKALIEACKYIQSRLPEDSEIKWVRVEDALPEVGQRVMVFVDNTANPKGIQNKTYQKDLTYYGLEGKQPVFKWSTSDMYPTTKVTHWHALLEDPKK